VGFHLNLGQIYSAFRKERGGWGRIPWGRYSQRALRVGGGDEGEIAGRMVAMERELDGEERRIRGGKKGGGSQIII
jgi:hypothetical protein